MDILGYTVWLGVVDDWHIADVISSSTTRWKHCRIYIYCYMRINYANKKHLKNVGPIRHCRPFYIAIHQVSLLSHAATVARRLRIDVYNDNDNA